MTEELLSLGSAVNRKSLPGAAVPPFAGFVPKRKNSARLRTLSPLGERISAAMHYAKIPSQNELERMLFPAGKGRGRVSRYMTGRRGQTYIDTDLFLRMAGLLGVDAFWLMTGLGNMLPPMQPHPESQRYDR